MGALETIGQKDKRKGGGNTAHTQKTVCEKVHERKRKMRIKTWNIEQITGYKPITTFYEDFSIADCFGASAVKDTFSRAFKHWKEDYQYLTELVMALNWKIWEHCETNPKLAELYNELWEQADLYATENLQGEELSYFYKTTD